MTLATVSRSRADGDTVIFAMASVGLRTHRRRTATSPEPKPRVVSPSTNCMVEVVIVTMADIPCGSWEIEMAAVWPLAPGGGITETEPDWPLGSDWLVAAGGVDCPGRLSKNTWLLALNPVPLTVTEPSGFGVTAVTAGGGFCTTRMPGGNTKISSGSVNNKCSGPVAGGD